MEVKAIVENAAIFLAIFVATIYNTWKTQQSRHAASQVDESRKAIEVKAGEMPQLAATASRETLNSWVTEFFKADILDLRERTHRAEDMLEKNADERRTQAEQIRVLQDRLAQQEVQHSQRIEAMQRQIDDLNAKVRQLQSERDGIAVQRDEALKKTQEQEREIKRLTTELDKATGELRKHEVEIARLQASNTLLQGVFDRLQVQVQPAVEPGVN